MIEVTLTVPDEALSALQMTPEQFVELRLAGAVKLYEMGRLSSGAARRLPYSSDRIPHPAGRLRRGHVPVDGGGFAAGDAIWLRSFANKTDRHSDLNGQTDHDAPWGLTPGDSVAGNGPTPGRATCLANLVEVRPDDAILNCGSHRARSQPPPRGERGQIFSTAHLFHCSTPSAARRRARTVYAFG